MPGTEETTAQPTPTTPNGRPDRAALLDEISNIGREAEPAKPDGESEAAADETPAAEVPKPGEGEPPDEADDEGDDDEGDEEEHDDEEDTKVPAPEQADPLQAKRIEAIQRVEKRAKEAMAAERAALEAERAKLKPQIEAAERFADLSRRARYDPAGVLLALGLTIDDLDPAARQVYAHSKSAADDPKMRDAATRMMREREHADELSRTRKELDELKNRIQEREEREATDRQVGAYLDDVAKAAGDEMPLVRTMLQKNPSGTRQRLHEIAAYLAEQYGEPADPADVAKALEQIRRRELEEMGLDVETVIKAKPKNTTPAAGEKKAARTLSNDLGTPTAPRTAPQSRKDMLADVRRALEEGRLD